MKTIFATILCTAVLLLSGQRAFTADATDELKTLVAKVQADLKAGKTTEADLSDDLKQFDALLAEHKAEKTDAVAQILVMKATLYLQVLNNPLKGTILLKQVKNDFPDTKWAAQVDAMLAVMEKQAQTDKIKETLKVGAKFPDFNETDVDGKPVSIASYKGKVVMIDFWATWCGPCMGEFPNVLATYQKHHAEGFEIIGVSLDSDKDAVTTFIKQKGVTWQQFFDGKGWSNKLAAQYGIESIPATFLLDGNGVIIGEDLRGPELEAAVAKAVKKN